MRRPAHGRGLFLTRDSGGKHEMTPAKYVEWAATEAQKLGVNFTGTPAQIDSMIRDGKSAEGDIFLDYDVKGNVLSRAGLDAIKSLIKRDSSVSHVFIPKRDRLARPDNPLDGVRLENELRAAGITVVFMDRVALPIQRGERQDIGDLIVSLIDYDSAGVFRKELARRIIFAQIALAQDGFSTGGRPPFGFRRWLVRLDGAAVRELGDGERVRMAGHHVVWLPGPEAELRLVRRILTMLEKMAASRVAAILNKDGIPSPDAGRYRADNGFRHQVSGLWHQTTITNIARNSLLVAVATHGLRSMGDQLRMTPNGPRPLSDDDYRDKQTPKVVRNPESQRIIVNSPSAFEPVIEPGRFNRLQLILDERGGTQRGKPRSHDPSKNPLGCRVFDWNCGRPMYREPYSKSFRYKCSLYQQSDGQQCAHNHIDGPLATRFVLSCVRQGLLSPSLLPKLRARLRWLAEDERSGLRPECELMTARAELAQVRREFERATKNLVRADDEEYPVIAAGRKALKERLEQLEAGLAKTESVSASGTNIDAEIDTALDLASRLVELANLEQLTAASDAIRLANAKLFVKFRPVQAKGRILNRIAGGVVTLGAAPPPFVPYEGPTSRSKVKRDKQEAADAATATNGRRSPSQPNLPGSGGEGTSLGNVNRGDRI